MYPEKLTNKPETKSSKDFHVEFFNAKIEKFKPTFGTSKARYGTKKVNDKMLELVRDHCNDKCIWITDPAIAEKEKQNKIAK